MRCRGTSSNRCSWLIIYCSTDPRIPQFLCCLPVGAWSSLFHILGLVSTYLGHSSPSAKGTEETLRLSYQQHTHTYSCHFQVQTPPLSCCLSSMGKVLQKVQPATAVMFTVSVLCKISCSWSFMWLFTATDPNPPAGWGPSVWNLHVLHDHVPAWVFSRYSGFLPQTKYIQVYWWLSIACRVECECEWLFASVYMSALWLTGNLCRVYPVFCPMSTEIGSMTL